MTLGVCVPISAWVHIIERILDVVLIELRSKGRALRENFKPFPNGCAFSRMLLNRSERRGIGDVKHNDLILAPASPRAAYSILVLRVPSHDLIQRVREILTGDALGNERPVRIYAPADAVYIHGKAWSDGSPNTILPWRQYSCR